MSELIISVNDDHLDLTNFAETSNC
eukprot:UN19383